jgi:hypothetical protein
MRTSTTYSRSTRENDVRGRHHPVPVGRKAHTVSTAKGILQHVLTDQAIDRALDLTATMFGLSKQSVSTIVQVGLPMMAKMAETNPGLLKRLYAASLATMPEPVDDFYVRMSESQAVRQATMDDYKATYGSMLDAVNRAAAKQAGTTDGQARDVIAAVLPAITQALGQSNGAGGTPGFLQQLKDLPA